jgi:hypothetical protein
MSEEKLREKLESKTGELVALRKEFRGLEERIRVVEGKVRDLEIAKVGNIPSKTKGER